MKQPRSKKGTFTPKGTVTFPKQILLRVSQSVYDALEQMDGTKQDIIREILSESLTVKGFLKKEKKIDKRG